MHGQKSKIFKRPKNREDGSDFDEIRTKKNRSDASCLMKKFSNERNERKVPEKFEKLSIFFRIIQKIDIADVINY